MPDTHMPIGGDDLRPGLGHNSGLSLADIAAALAPSRLQPMLVDTISALSQRSTQLAAACGRLARSLTATPVVTDLDAPGRVGEIIWLDIGEGSTFCRWIDEDWTPIALPLALRLLLPLAHVPDEETAQRMTSFAAQIKAASKEAEGARVAAKKPFDDAAKAVQATFKVGLTDPLDEMVKGIEHALTAYANRKAAEERALRQAEEARLRREAEAAAALAKATEHPEILEEALAAAERHDQAALAAQKPLRDLGRVSGSLGGVAAMLTTYRYRVIDEAAIPRQYWVLDTAALARDVKRLKDKADIPGIEVYAEAQASVR